MPNRYVPVRSSLPLKENILVATALNAGVVPEKINLEGVERKTLFLSPLLAAKVDEASQTHDLPFDQAFYSLLLAGVRIIEGQKADFVAKVAQADPPPFRGGTPEQTRFFKNIVTSLEGGRICLAEGSTGIGKSRAMLAAAMKMAERKKKVVIAAPTLKILGQLFEEFEFLKKEGVGVGVTGGFFPGVTEFVSPSRLAKYFEELPDDSNPETADPEARKWVAEGGPMLSSWSPLVRAMGAPVSFLAEDLRQISVNLPVEDFLLRRGEKEEHPSLGAIQKSAVEADLLFCTHAMLARAHQERWSAFPAPEVLIVDEAHLLEMELARIHSMSLSLASLYRRLQETALAQGAKSHSVVFKALKECIKTRNRLRKIGRENGHQRLRIAPGMEFFEEMKDILENLDKNLSSRSLSVVRDINDDREVVRECLEILGGRKGSGVLEFSSDPRFSVLVAGRETVGDILGNLWKSVGSAAACSASLFTPDEFGDIDPDFMLSLLALPRGRTDTPLPVVAPWVTDIPTMHLPSPELSPRLSRTPGKTRTQETESDWMANVALQCRKIAEEAKGGTLILASSYSQVEALAAGLSDIPNRLVVQRPEEKFQLAEDRFRSLHRLHRRPVLIGTGVAWTGVDLTDKSVAPDKDSLLTDLVIACLPIGLNRTTSAYHRFQTMGIESLAKETLLILRQGLGRLVRHPQAKDKHIWVLDGRIFSGEWPHFQRFQKVVRRMLGPVNYQKNSTLFSS